MAFVCGFLYIAVDVQYYLCNYGMAACALPIFCNHEYALVFHVVVGLVPGVCSELN
jgi:hypothetical protein